MCTNTLHRRVNTEKANKLIDAGLSQCVHTNCKKACASAGAVTPAKGKSPATVRCGRRDGQSVTAAEIGPVCGLIKMPGNVHPERIAAYTESVSLKVETPDSISLTMPLVTT